MPSLRTRLAQLLAASVLTVAGTAAVAADTIVHLPLKAAVDAAIASGKIDGSVKFHLAGASPRGTVIRADVVTNKKSNAFNKSDEDACQWTAQSAIIQLHEAALKAGANAVINIESYFRKKVYTHPQNYECHVGAVMSGVALRGDLAKVGR